PPLEPFPPPRFSVLRVSARQCAGRTRAEHHRPRRRPGRATWCDIRPLGSGRLAIYRDSAAGLGGHMTIEEHVLSRVVSPAGSALGESAPAALELRDVHHSYATGGGRVPVLAGVDLDVHRGEFVAIV